MNKKPIDLTNLIKISVRQLENKNQFIISYQDKENNDLLAFQSYATLIAIWSYKDHLLYINWDMFDYSKTTLKHLKIFINRYTAFNYLDKQQFTKLILNDDKVILFNDR